MKKFVLKFISLILIFIILISSMQAIFVQNNVYAADNVPLSSSYTQYVTSGISSFPESYQTLLAYLKWLHPNWEFNAYYTGIPWDQVTSSQAENQCITDAGVVTNSIYKGNNSSTDPVMDQLVPCSCGRTRRFRVSLPII